MKNLLCIVLLTTGFSLYSQNNSTLSKLEATYKGYMISCDKGDGKKALSYLDNNSKVFFELLLYNLWYADSITIERMSTSERCLILLIRQLNTPEQILSFQPNSFAIYVLSTVGPPGVSSPEGFTLGNLRKEGDKAYAKLIVRGNPREPEYEFTKENDQWKISLIPFMQYAEISLGKRFQRKHTSDRGLNLFLIEGFSGKPIDPAIWHPVKN